MNMGVITVLVAVVALWFCAAAVQGRSIREADPDNANSTSCMVRWLELVPGVRSRSDAPRYVQLFTHFLRPPLDETNVHAADLTQLSLLVGKQTADDFIKCITKTSTTCALNAPCQNGGQCVFTDSQTKPGYQCRCDPDFRGHSCETQILSCDRDPCQNGGRCQGNTTHYQCSCPRWFSGVNCERAWSNQRMWTKLHRRVYRMRGAVKTNRKQLAGVQTSLGRIETSLNQNKVVGLFSALNQRLTDITTWLGSLSDDVSLMKHGGITPCNLSLCQNGGSCQPNGSSYTCLCPPLVSGDLCQDAATCYRHVGGDSGTFTSSHFGGYTAYCDRSTEGGGWTVIQRRRDGTVDFNKTWEEYKHGFGHPNGNFWLGLETIHQLTSQPSRPYELRIDMTYASDGSEHFVKYSSFSVGPESDRYTLHLSDYSSPDVGDYLIYHGNYPFSTNDRDNDNHDAEPSCAVYYAAGWWFTRCMDVNLNGVYGRPENQWEGITWYRKQLSAVEMKIRPTA